MEYHSPTITTEELYDAELGDIGLFRVQCRYNTSVWPYPNNADGTCKNNQAS